MFLVWICLFVLIDIRHKAQFIDQEFMIKIGKQDLPFVIVFTKSDKISLSQATKNIEKYRNEMLKNWEYLPEIFITSSEKKKGLDNILKFIETHNKLFDPILIQ